MAVVDPLRPWLIFGKEHLVVREDAWPMTSFEDHIPASQEKLYRLLEESVDHRWYAMAEAVPTKEKFYPQTHNYAPFATNYNMSRYWDRIHLQLYLYATHYTNSWLLERLARHEFYHEAICNLNERYFSSDFKAIRFRFKNPGDTNGQDRFKSKIEMMQDCRMSFTDFDYYAEHSKTPPDGSFEILIHVDDCEELFAIYLLGYCYNPDPYCEGVYIKTVRFVCLGQCRTPHIIFNNSIAMRQFRHFAPMIRNFVNREDPKKITFKYAEILPDRRLRRNLERHLSFEMGV